MELVELGEDCELVFAVGEVLEGNFLVRFSEKVDLMQNAFLQKRVSVDVVFSATALKLVDEVEEFLLFVCIGVGGPCDVFIIFFLVFFILVRKVFVCVKHFCLLAIESRIRDSIQ
jgi:hypothetical protein